MGHPSSQIMSYSLAKSFLDSSFKIQKSCWRVVPRVFWSYETFASIWIVIEGKYLVHNARAIGFSLEGWNTTNALEDQRRLEENNYKLTSDVLDK